MKCGTPLSRRSRNVDLLSRTTSLLKRSMMLICCVDIYTRTHFQTLRVFGQSPGWTLCSVITMLRWNSHHAVSSHGSPSGLSSTTCLPPPPLPHPPITSRADPPNEQQAWIRWCVQFLHRRSRNTEPERCHIHQCDCYELACHWVHSSHCDVNRGMTHRLQWNEKERVSARTLLCHDRVCVCACVYHNR